MSAVTDTGTAAPPQRSYTESVRTILSMLLGREKNIDCLYLEAWTYTGFGRTSLMVQRGNRDELQRWLPAALLSLLSEDPPNWHVRASAAAYDGQQMRCQPAVFARWVLKALPRSATKLDPAGAEAIRTALRAFSLEPSAVIDAGTEVVALWQLDRPLSLKGADRLEVARALQSRLAVALGAGAAGDTHPNSDPRHRGVVGAHDPAGYLPLCGIVRTMGQPGHPPLITFPVVEPSNVYELPAIEQAIEEAKQS